MQTNVPLKKEEKKKVKRNQVDRRGSPIIRITAIVQEQKSVHSFQCQP